MRTNIALIQADDGTIKDDAVDLPTLADDVINYITTNGNGWFASDTGLVDAMVVTLAPAPTSLTNGMFVVSDLKLTNTATAVTLNVNGLGAKAVVLDGAGTLPTIGQLTIGTFYGFQYDSSADKFQIVFSGDSLTHSASASVSATAAASSASEAATHYDNFSDRYLGAKTSDPTLDDDGNALLDGALFFRTDQAVMKVYDLSSTTWLLTKPSSSDQTAINSVNTNISAVNTCSTNISSINTVSTNISDVVAVANDLAEAVSEVVTVADDLNEATSEIDTVANNIANINTVGGISSDVSALAGKVTEIGLLGTSANVSSMSNLGTSANVTNMGNLGTSANVTAMSNCSGSISSITNVSSNLASVNAFASTYRISSSAPTTSLDIGDLYFDSTQNELKVYKSSGWAAAGSTVNGTSARFTYNISGTPSSVTGADVNGETLAYDAGFADVFLNGVRLSASDITITSGTSVVFASALANGDVVDIVAYGTFNVAAINASNVNSGTLGTDRLPTIPVAKGGTNLTALGNADEVLKVNSAGNALEYGTASSPEVYGFNVDATGNLIVTTTNKGADSITEATYATFDDVVYASSNMSWSLSGTNLRVTI